MTSKQKQIIYGVVAVLGFAIPWYFNIKFMTTHGAGDVLSFVNGCFANPAAGSLTMDAIIGAAAFTAFVLFEGSRLKMKNIWVYIVLIPTVAFAFSFPLFLLMRERQLNKNSKS